MMIPAYHLESAVFLLAALVLGIIKGASAERWQKNSCWRHPTLSLQTTNSRLTTRQFQPPIPKTHSFLPTGLSCGTIRFFQAGLFVLFFPAAVNFDSAMLDYKSCLLQLQFSRLLYFIVLIRPPPERQPTREGWPNDGNQKDSYHLLAGSSCFFCVGFWPLPSTNHICSWLAAGF
jgi:hypothetical protein